MSSGGGLGGEIFDFPFRGKDGRWRHGGRWLHVREFRSGMVGIAPGETLRINFVNAASRAPEAAAKLVWALGWANPDSEPLRREIFSLRPGASAFLDIPAPDEKPRHEVRTEVI